MTQKEDKEDRINRKEEKEDHSQTRREPIEDATYLVVTVDKGDWTIRRRTIRRGRFVADYSSHGQFVAWTISRRQFVAMLIRCTDNSSHEWSVVSELDLR